MDPLTNPAYLVFAAIAPMLIALVKQSGLSRQANALIATICYVLVGIAGALMSGEEMTAENIVPFVAVASVVGTAAYGLIWRNLGGNEDTSLEQRVVESTSILK